MNRIVINLDARGCFTVYSDEPIWFYCVSDHTPADRVYQMDVEVGVAKVRDQLRNDPVGHINFSQVLGSGYGPRKPPSKRKLEVGSMTFSGAFAVYGPDTIAISEALNIPEHEADRLVTERMNARYARRTRDAKGRASLAEIRTRRPA